MSHESSFFHQLTINEKKKLRLQKESQTIPEEDQARENSSTSDRVSNPKLPGLQKKVACNLNSIYYPSANQKTIQEADPPKKSFIKRFFQALGCCYQSEDLQNQNSNFGVSSSDRNSCVNTNNGYFIDPITRNASNSSSWLFNILQFPISGYSPLKLGHFGFLQIPVKFERVGCEIDRTVYEMISKHFLSQNDMPYTLILQQYFDSDLPVCLSKYSSHTLCVFSELQTSFYPQKTISSEMTSSAIKYFPHPEISISNKEMKNVDFLKCNNFQMAVQQDLFDKIIIIPTSLKQQANAFDENFAMKLEFKIKFLQCLNEFQHDLAKTIFILPKYCRIREIMILIYDCFIRSDIPLHYLNFGIQFHSFINAQQEVEAIALIFDPTQSDDTLSAISHRVFSNISPEKNNQMNTQQVLSEREPQQQNQIVNPEVSSIQSVDKSNFSPMSLTKSNNNKDVENFVVVEEEVDNYPHNQLNKEDVKSSSINQILDFGGTEYVNEMSRCKFKDLYSFLKEINICFIIHQENTFFYRTHIIDTMLSHSLIQANFISLLLDHFLQYDKMNPPNIPKQEIPQKSRLFSKDFKNFKSNQPSNFKEYFIKNSKHYLPPVTPPQTIDISIVQHQENENIQSIAATDIDIYGLQHLNQKNNCSTFESSNAISPNEKILTQDPQSSESISTEIREKEAKLKDLKADQIKTRPKQISCNYSTSSGSNKHVGFMKKRHFQSIILDADILKSTLASRIVNSKDPKDKKLIEDLKNWQIGDHPNQLGESNDKNSKV